MLVVALVTEAGAWRKFATGILTASLSVLVMVYFHFNPFRQVLMRLRLDYSSALYVGRPLETTQKLGKTRAKCSCSDAVGRQKI